MIARLAYLTTPGPDRFVLNIQPFGSDDIIRFEIAKAHLANILIDGAALALREYSSNRVPETKTKESAHGDDRRQQPA
jgi:hypothetical protein